MNRNHLDGKIVMLVKVCMWLSFDDRIALVVEIYLDLEGEDIAETCDGKLVFTRTSTCLRISNDKVSCQYWRQSRGTGLLMSLSAIRLKLCTVSF